MPDNKFWFGLLFIIFVIGSAFATEKRPLTVEDLFAMGRVSDPQISPDGKWIAYTITNYSMETNGNNSDIWLVSVDGKAVKQLTTSPKGDSQPRWCPKDPAKMAFISSRNGTPQIFILSLAGGEPSQLTDISTGASSPVWSPDGQHLAFVSEVYPDLATDAENAARDQEREESLVQAKVIDGLLYRHWNAWRDNKRSHVFLVPASGGLARDVTPGDWDTPPISLGGQQDFCFSPDSKEIAFVRNPDPMVAISTNNDIFVVPVAGGEAKPITTTRGNDNNPVYSPDGRFLAFRSMARPGFEADQDELILLDRAKSTRTNLTEQFDRSVGELVFAPDGQKIYFTAFDFGRTKIYSVPVTGGDVHPVYGEHENAGLQITPDGKTLVFAQQRANLPHEIFRISTSGKDLAQLTFTNQKRLNALALQPVEDFNFKSFDGTPVHGLLVKPPFFDAAKKYPMIFLIHGGPQGGWSDDFHYRWNSNLFVAPGYVVVMVNFRGSTGYGQKFCDAVSQNWGGGPYQDLMTGLDYVLQTFDFIDSTKIAAAGASYGGYMINWMATHTGRFKALVSHSGAYDLRSKYGATEELWFPEWEFAGTPWDRPELYEKWSPSVFAGNLSQFKTPTLVIHGQLDFRVPVTQSFQFFTALQRQGVPSRLIYFPDEDHFIRKPQNARLWWTSVHEWIARWLNL